MLSIFDWLRRCRSGAELLATMKCHVLEPHLFPNQEEIGSPFCFSDGPCQRCWIYPPCRTSSRLKYCKACMAIMRRAAKLGDASRRSVVIWAFVNRVPGQLQRSEGFYKNDVTCFYVHDDNHFLMMMNRYKLKAWLQELLIYHGPDLKGLIQIFSTTGETRKGGMGDILCRAVHQESRFPMDQLRIRFFPDPYQLLTPHVRDKEGLLTFEVTEFLRLLEMTTIFRALLPPREQEMLRDLTNLNDSKEEHFYWGRFMGYLSPEAKDMLSSWNLRQWPKNRIRLLYELANYAPFTP
ncbi:MAG: hypothetical protein BA872_02425 [Desulfobacterales bacterium C00003060]|nr:MAG: hypothetical protein BA861_01475 [Desulfobacterales bacterium S3730MH5]OEU80046.1 MAG: hypothetical protein BA872_02425 [Desulfobacterales bacterium C00003060]